jgi:starvation-inducible DNA-binding protein
MDELIDRLNKVLADSYQFSLKSHFYHWNVTGPDFPQYHDFLGDIYAEVRGSIDQTAEYIRTIDGVPHNSPSMVRQNSDIKETSVVKPALEMISDLVSDTAIAVNNLMDAMEMADKFNEVGISNYLQERHAAYKKHAWMLKSTLKS